MFLQDYNARQMIAYTLSQGLGQNIKADNVIAVSAMEAVGVAAAMERFQAISGNPKVHHHEHKITGTNAKVIQAGHYESSI